MPNIPSSQSLNTSSPPPPPFYMNLTFTNLSCISPPLFIRAIIAGVLYWFLFRGRLAEAPSGQVMATKPSMENLNGIASLAQIQIPYTQHNVYRTLTVALDSFQKASRLILQTTSHRLLPRWILPSRSRGWWQSRRRRRCNQRIPRLFCLQRQRPPHHRPDRWLQMVPVHVQMEGGI